MKTQTFKAKDVKSAINLSIMNLEKEQSLCPQKKITAW